MDSLSISLNHKECLLLEDILPHLMHRPVSYHYAECVFCHSEFDINGYSVHNPNCFGEALSKKLMAAIDGYSPSIRAAEKQQSRDQDQLALDAGDKSREELKKENSMFTGIHVRVNLEGAKSLT